MLNVASECLNYTPIKTEHYSLGEFAEDLIRILPGSPEAFCHLLALAFDNKFDIEEADLHSMVSYITAQVGNEKLEQYLRTQDKNKAIKPLRHPEIDDAVSEKLDADGLQLAIILTRHMYRDMSETDSDMCRRSNVAINSGVGHFTTKYLLSGCSILVSTEMKSYRLRITLA